MHRPIIRNVYVTADRVDAARLFNLLSRSRIKVHSLSSAEAVELQHLEDSLIVTQSPLSVCMHSGSSIEHTMLDDAGDWTFAVASHILRRNWMVSDAESLEEINLYKVRVDPGGPHSEHGTAEAEHPEGGEQGVLLIKPSNRATQKTLDELARRCSAAGYVIRAVRYFTGTELARLNIVTSHYLAHFDSSGHLEAHERLALLKIYDGPQFEARFRLPAADVPVVSWRALLDGFTVSRSRLKQWSEISARQHGLNSGTLDGPNEIGDHKFVNLFSDPDINGGRPLFVLNPHMPTVMDLFEEPSARCIAFHLEAVSSQALSWKRMRAEFCGPTDPAQAPPGSLRGDSFAGVFPLTSEGGGRIGRTNNGFHLSNGPVEAVRELSIWFEVPANAISAGRALAGAGMLAENRLTTHAYVDYPDRRRVVAEVTRGCSPEAAYALLSGGRLTVGHTPATKPEELQAIDEAWQRIQPLRRNPQVKAVLWPEAQVRRARSPAGCREVLLVLQDHATLQGISISPNLSAEYLRIDAVMERLYPTERSIEHIQAAARIANGLPLWDPDCIFANHFFRVAALKPELSFIHSLFDRASALVDRSSQMSIASRAFRDDFAEAYEMLADIRLSLHPLRYGALESAPEDLCSIDEAELASDLRSARRWASTESREYDGGFARRWGSNRRRICSMINHIYSSNISADVRSP